MFLKKVVTTVDSVLEYLSSIAGRPAVFVSFCVFVGYVVLNQRFGFAHPETYSYIPTHLSVSDFSLRSLFIHFLDVRKLDAWCFPVRNLSYVFDFIDAQFIGLSLRFGLPHFLSLTHFSFVFLITQWMWGILARDLKLDRFIAWMILIALLLTPTFHSSASYFRSAKIGASLGVAWCLYLIARPTFLPIWLAFLTTFVLSFFDQFSIAFLFYFVMVLAVLVYFVKLVQFQKLFYVFFSALFLSLGLTRFFIPVLFQNLLSVPYQYTKIPAANWMDVLHKPISWITNVFSMFIDYVRFLWGTPAFAVAIVMIVISIAISLDALSKRYNRRMAWAMMGVVILPILGLLFFLRVGHLPISHEDIRRHYYGLPFQVLIAAWTGWMALIWGERIGLQKTRWIAALMVLGSLSSLDGHIKVVRQGHMSQWIAVSPKILAGLKSFHRTGSDDGLEDEVRNNSLYRSLKDYLIAHR